MIISKYRLPSSEAFLSAAGLICADTACSSDDLLFFDIETTGLSADTSYLYLIGCMYLEDGNAVLEQFFSEGINEESQLISEFWKLSQQHRLTVHFNGQTFDIPYINRKKDLLHLECPDFEPGYDIFRVLRPCKGFFALSSMSQKSLEQFCGLNRVDQYGGGELIEFYNRYLAVKRLEQMRSGQTASVYRADKSSGLTQIGELKSEELLSALLLHNREDVLGMLKVSELLGFTALKSGHFRPDSLSVGKIETDDYGNSSVKFFLCCETPVPFSIIREKCSVICLNGSLIYLNFPDENSVELTVPVTHTELKLYYPDYRNYRYLPAEDCAIHRSVADFLDNSLKVNCTAANCYSRHTLNFLPIPGKLSKSDSSGFMLFRYDIHDKMGYVSLDELISSQEFAIEYVLKVLEAL